MPLKPALSPEVTAKVMHAAARPSEEGEIVIVQEDFKFIPKTIRVKAGQEVTLVLINNGAKEHELMIGRNTHAEDGITEPFTQDFFEGIMVEVAGAGIAMGGPMEEMAGMEEQAEEGDEHSMGLVSDHTGPCNEA
jgi:plastocyanin